MQLLCFLVRCGGGGCGHRLSIVGQCKSGHSCLLPYSGKRPPSKTTCHAVSPSLFWYSCVMENERIINTESPYLIHWEIDFL